MSGLFDFAILSDTRDGEIAAMEELWFARLVTEARAKGRMFYRRRADNAGKKPAISKISSPAGGAYEFALILDADSLMSGETIVEMARRMEAEPELGLLQTLPRIINARSLLRARHAVCGVVLFACFCARHCVARGARGAVLGS